MQNVLVDDRRIWVDLYVVLFHSRTQPQASCITVLKPHDTQSFQTHHTARHDADYPIFVIAHNPLRRRTLTGRTKSNEDRRLVMVRLDLGVARTLNERGGTGMKTMGGVGVGSTEWCLMCLAIRIAAQKIVRVAVEVVIGRRE